MFVQEWQCGVGFVCIWWCGSFFQMVVDDQVDWDDENVDYEC